MAHGKNHPPASPKSKEAKSQLGKTVFGIVGLVILVSSIVGKEAFRDEYKDSVAAIDSAESAFLLKSDTLKLLGELWQVSNPPEPRKKGQTALFTIPTPSDSDVNDYLDSAARLVEKLPEADKPRQQIEALRAQNDQLVRDAKHLYSQYPQNVTREGKYRMEIAFDNLASELEFRKRVETIRNQIVAIETSFSSLQKALVDDAEKQKRSEEKHYKTWRWLGFGLIFIGAMVTLIAILKDVEGVEAIG